MKTKHADPRTERDMTDYPSAYASPACVATIRLLAPPYIVMSQRDAPACLPDLRMMHRAYGRIPVSGEHCENTVYGSATANHAFRAWHDSIHLALTLGMSYEEEIKVGHAHLAVAGRYGLSTHDINILYFDTIGHAMYHEKNGRFPCHQSEYAGLCMLALQKRCATNYDAAAYVNSAYPTI